MSNKGYFYTSAADSFSRFCASVGIDARRYSENTLCSECNGEGTQSLGGASFSSEDFAEDPEFAEAYFAGRYDSACSECKGAKVVRLADLTALPANLQHEWAEWDDSRRAGNAESLAERRMGC